MHGSSTPGRHPFASPRAPGCIAFRPDNNVGSPVYTDFVAQSLFVPNAWLSTLKRARYRVRSMTRYQ